MPHTGIADGDACRWPRARFTCIDPQRVPLEFAVRELTLEMLDHLPNGIDQCGENGEFHTFVFDGPSSPGPSILKWAKWLPATDLYLWIAGCAVKRLPRQRTGDVMDRVGAT